jgi:aspartyl-tRNA(Asn)/glutamyl-tRNA(Gln) amidotransferase subunit A
MAAGADGQTVAGLQRALRAGELSSREAVQGILNRIEETESAINAYVMVAGEEALAAADALDDALAAASDFGPLHGIPVAVKDLFDTKGMRTAGGGMLDPERVPEEDATAVARLRRAGAVIVGKTNTHEYAYGYTTENPHYGTTHNPWDTTRIAGGSSGGSGASLAAGSAVAALGSDTGGSIRVPASFCGIAGIKPTYGRVSKKGVFPLAWSLDHAGPMATTVRDLAILLGVIAGFDPGDPTSVRRDVPDYTASLTGDIRGVRVGVPANHFFDRVEPEVRDGVHGAIAKLEELGAIPIEVTIADLEGAVSAWLAILLSEATSIHEQDLRVRPEVYGDDVRLYLEEGTLVPASMYLKAQRVRTRMVRAFGEAMQQVDVLATPATALVATPCEQPEIEIDGEQEALFHALARISSPFDMTGLPAASIPCGFTTGGLPIGLQLVGHAYAEETVLRVADAYEQATEWSRRRAAPASVVASSTD